MRTKEASHSHKGIQTCWHVWHLQKVQGLSLAGLPQSLVGRRGWSYIFLLSLPVQGALAKAFPSVDHFFPCSWPQLLAISWS